MATTGFLTIHVNKGKTIAQTLFDRTGYIKNEAKTEGGVLVAGYACDPRTVDEEFLISKREYERISPRGESKRNILAYHARQSFKPGEITPQEALDVGYELAMRFTKGNHAFVVSVHTDKAHIHCHAVFNSTTLDCTRKFNNFWNSSYALGRLSDLICAEHGLSVIENPKPSKGSYGSWLGDKKATPHRKVLKGYIDEVLPQCATFEDFLAKLAEAGFEVNAKRKHISIKAPRWGKPARIDSLGRGYTEAEIRAKLGNANVITGGSGSGTRIRVSLLVDIQEKIREGKGAGYTQWAKIFNLKEAAKTLIFLKENGIDSYDDLVKKSSSASGDFSALTKRIKEIEGRQKKISELQKQIGTYGKTKDIYAKYKASGWDRGFYDIHAADIILHRAAKKHFNEIGMKKLPSINQLRQEYATLSSERKTLYSGYHKNKDLSRELATARANAERILGIEPDAQNNDASRTSNRHDLYEI